MKSRKKQTLAYMRILNINTGILVDKNNDMEYIHICAFCHTETTDTMMITCRECKEHRIACPKCFVGGRLRCIKCQREYKTVTLDYTV